MKVLDGRKYITIDEAPREILTRIIEHLDVIVPEERWKLAEWARGEREHIYLNPHYFPEQTELFNRYTL